MKLQKNKIIVIGIIIGIIVIFIVYRVIRKQQILKKYGEDVGIDEGEVEDKPVNIETQAPTKLFPLQMWSGYEDSEQRRYVKALQKYLNREKGANLNVDGLFGTNTRSAVNKYIGGNTISAFYFDQFIKEYV
jgi:peptidoglycan hydrolase-like protein with peptidoglycan-binding domain